MCINFEESHKLVNEVTVDFSLVFFKKNVTSFYTPHAPYNVLSTFSNHTLNTHANWIQNKLCTLDQ